MKDRVQSIVLPLLVAVVFVAGWHAAVKLSETDIFPTPLMVVAGLVELAQKGVQLPGLIDEVESGGARSHWGAEQTAYCAWKKA